jgi:hypothetical protein
MVSRQNLRGLGMPWGLARFLGQGTNTISAAGATGPSATLINGEGYNTFVTAGTSGVMLPAIGGDFNTNNGDVGDQYALTNVSGAAIVVYAPGTMTFVGAGTSTAGSTGVSVGNLSMVIFNACTVTTYGINT